MHIEEHEDEKADERMNTEEIPILSNFQENKKL
jgi:hypothetical protein